MASIRPSIAALLMHAALGHSAPPSLRGFLESTTGARPPRSWSSTRRATAKYRLPRHLRGVAAQRRAARKARNRRR